MTTKYKANKEFNETLKDQSPHLCKCLSTKKYFVTVFFSTKFIESKGFKVIK